MADTTPEQKTPVSKGLAGIQERMAGSVHLGLFAWEGDEPWQRMEKVRADMSRLLAEVERLTKSVGAFSTARDQAKAGWERANAEVEQLTIERDQARADRQAAWDGLRETEPKVDRVAALAADLQRHGDTEGARLIFAALNGERA